MKIVCGSCQAKYSIADEKVAGKVFKIRCKRCSEVIVVRGDQEAAPQAAAAPAYDAAADAIWHIVINGEQAGPYTPSQLGEMLSAGHVDWEAYVWCEGLENWAPMRDLPDLVAAITGQGQAQQAAPAAMERVSYASQPSMGADPFADDGGGGLFDSPAAAPASRSNLFGGGAADSGGFGSSPGVIASAPSPRVSAEQAMTGARNENSVLFSLKNLQALATGSSSSSGLSTAGPAPSAGNRPGFAGGEGSGLIDIRALASATGVSSETAREENEKDALLSLGSAQTGAFGALGSPMLAPAASDDGSSKKGLIFAIVGGCALLAVAGIAAAVILRPSPDAQPVAAVAPVAPPPMAAAAAAVNPAAAAATKPEAAEPPSEGELAARRAAEAAAEEERKASRSSTSSSGASARRRDDKTESAPAAPSRSEPVAAAPKVEEKPKPKGGSSSIDDLLDNAITGGGGSKPKPAAAPAADSNLPDKPSRDDVLTAMNGVKGEVLACAKGQTGVAFADVTVSGKTGRVSSAEITGITGEAGSCIARAVRKATFPKFKSETFQVKFPYRL